MDADVQNSSDELHKRTQQLEARTSRVVSSPINAHYIHHVFGSTN